MKTIEFTLENSPVSKAVFDSKSIDLTFKSGTTYQFSIENYMAGIKDQFKKIKTGEIKLDELEDSVKAAINKKIKDDADYHKIKYPDTIDQIAIEALDSTVKINNTDEIPTELHDFETVCTSILNIKDMIGNGEDIQTYILNYMQNFFMSQDYRILSRGNELDWVCVDSNDEIYKKMYFYTKHESENGFEIWYKAYDPIIWFGKKVQNKTAAK